MNKYDEFVDQFLTNLKNSLPMTKEMLLEDFLKLPVEPLFMSDVSFGKSTGCNNLPFRYHTSLITKIMHPTKEQSDSFAKTSIEPTQTMRGRPVLDLPKQQKAVLAFASSQKQSENIVANLLFCDECEKETVKPIILQRQNRFNNRFWIVKDREDFQREAFGQRIINVTNGTRFYFDPEQNCNVYESWVTIPTIDRQKVLGLNTTTLEESQWLFQNLGLPWEPTEQRTPHIYPFGFQK